MPVFTTPGAVHLKVANPCGDVTIEAIEGDTTEVVLTAARSDDPQAQVEHHQRGGRHEVTVTVPRNKTRLFGLLADEVTVTVRLPRGASASVISASADVRVRGEMGRLEVKSASGDVRVEQARDAQLATVSGDVDLGRATGSCTAVSVSGDVRVGHLDGDLKGKSVSGDLTVDCAAQGVISARSVSGDLTVRVQRGSRVVVDAASTSGDVRSELELSDARPEGDGPTVSIQALSVSGAVRVARAAEADSAA